MLNALDNSAETPKEETLLMEENETIIQRRKEKKKRTDPVTFSSRLSEINLKMPNIILETAKPLLRIITDIPDQIEPNDVDEFRNILEDEIEIFSGICEHLSVKREHAITARYCLCTALDEVINRTSWGGGDETEAGYWSKNSLLSTFHKDSYGGDKLFLLTGKLSAHPSEHIDVLELIYYLLALGFEGRYRHDANGKRQLDMIKSRLFNIINSERQKTSFSLAPHWTPTQPVSKKTGWRLPIGLLASVALLILAGQFLWYKLKLNYQVADLNSHIMRIGDIPFKPQQISFEKPKLAILLHKEITDLTLSLTETEDTDLVSFRGDGMFASGKAVVNQNLHPIFERIVTEVKKLPDTSIVVSGHSDNTPIKTAEFQDNNSLSKARAEAVAKLLEHYGYPKTLITVIGKGSVSPVSDNKTPEGRAKNRRVEILVQYKQKTNASTKNNLQQLDAADQVASSNQEIATP